MFTEQEKKKRLIICPVADENNKLRVVEANPGNLLQLMMECLQNRKEPKIKRQEL